MERIKKEGVLTERDLALIEKLTSKLSGDLAEAIGRGFERLEERVDALESRVSCRLSEIGELLPAGGVGSLGASGCFTSGSVHVV